MIDNGAQNIYTQQLQGSYFHVFNPGDLQYKQLIMNDVIQEFQENFIINDDFHPIPS